MNRAAHYICIHGHFYQPPRENPWLEAVELQDSAYPYHDWNARITAESYWPNAAARIFDMQGRIDKIISNYARMSFNFGPTLLAWLAEQAPEAYAAILDADRESQNRFGGHGSALAQAYNHMILPLANRRDKITQVRWGISDFVARFRRLPEGMWLPEAAVDLETLDILAAEGILFTVLSPHQAARVRPLAPGGDFRSEEESPENGEGWIEVSGGRIDPTRPYLVKLPSGRSLALFFYDGPISQAIAFNRLLENGEVLAQRLLDRFSRESNRPQLVNVATDGETYGHHHHYGELALAHALQYVELYGQARLTNYGEYLALYPPEEEVEIFENSSWSCPHGIERWRRNCGCNVGGHPDWNQNWRQPLREALDWLRDTLAELSEPVGQALFRDFWAARDGYIEVILHRNGEEMTAFLEREAQHSLDQRERIRALKLMELQRHTQLMYTSCGWFFDELSGIETIQVLQYAGRAVQLAEELFSCPDLEEGFLQRLGQALSNFHELGSGRSIYEDYVRPAMVDLPKVVGHYALSLLFNSYPEESHIYSYEIQRENYHWQEWGRTRMGAGRVRIRSCITEEEGWFDFGVVHFGDQNLSGGVRLAQPQEEYQRMLMESQAAFERTDLPEVLQVFTRYFGELHYSLRSLFRDEQRVMMQQVLAPILQEAENIYYRLYQQYAPLMHFILDLKIPLPEVFQGVPQVALNSLLRRDLQDPTDRERIMQHFNAAQELGCRLDISGLEFVFRATLERAALDFRERPEEFNRLECLEMAVDLMALLPFPVNTWRTQNLFYEVLLTEYPRMAAQAMQLTVSTEYPMVGPIQSLPSISSIEGMGIPPTETSVAVSLLVSGIVTQPDPALSTSNSEAVVAAARRWLEHFQRIGSRLGIRIPEPGKA